MSNTAEYFGLTQEQAYQADELWQMPTKNWPKELVDYVNGAKVSCGVDVMQALADLVKQNPGKQITPPP